MSVDLVTGATGLVGGNLVRTLIEYGRNVRVIIRKESNTSCLDEIQGIDIIEGDITNISTLQHACKGVEYVYHCAALISMLPRMAEMMWNVNVEGTRNVIQAAITNSVRRLIHCSTVDAFGLPETNIPSNESNAWNWDRLGLENPYARTKFEAQQSVLDYAKEELDAVIVNPTYMFGEYDLRPSSGQMILEIASGKGLFYPSGGNNFVDVEDVTKAMVVAAQKGRCGECYILGNENLTYREIFTKIATILNINPPQIPLPYPVARVSGWGGDLASMLTGKELKIVTNTVKLGYIDHYYDSQKAVNELEMPQTPIDYAIERAVQWFQNEGMI